MKEAGPFALCCRRTNRELDAVVDQMLLAWWHFVEHHMCLARSNSVPHRWRKCTQTTTSPYSIELLVEEPAPTKLSSVFPL
jgi:hypothetical protein